MRAARPAARPLVLPVGRPFGSRERVPPLLGLRQRNFASAEIGSLAHTNIGASSFTPNPGVILQPFGGGEIVTNGFTLLVWSAGPGRYRVQSDDDHLLNFEEVVSERNFASVQYVDAQGATRRKFANTTASILRRWPSALISLLTQN